MKKLVSGILALLLCLPVAGQVTDAVPLQAVAVDEAEDNTVTVDGLIYEVVNNGDTFYDLIGVEDTGITSVTIPAEVNGYSVNIGNPYFLRECQNLVEINVEEGEENPYHSLDGVLCSGKAMIAYPRGREGDYTIPEGIFRINSGAFAYCKKLTSITLPESLKEIEGNAFFHCSALEEIIGKIPPGYMNGVFMHCSSLKSIEFAAPSDKYDRDYLVDLNLANCTSLEKIVFPKNLRLLGTTVIGNCPKLTELNLPDTVQDLQLTQYDALEELYVPYCRSLKIDRCENLRQIHAALEGGGIVTIKECPELESISLYGRSGTTEITLSDCSELKALKLYDEERPFRTLTLVKSVNHMTLYSIPDYQHYCDERNIPFELLKPYTGDANDDGVFNAVDIIALQKYLLNSGRLTYWKNCDLNDDSEVDVFDLVLMKRALLNE